MHISSMQDEESLANLDTVTVHTHTQHLQTNYKIEHIPQPPEVGIIEDTTASMM